MSVLSSTKAEQKLALISGRKCDKYDYLIAVGCGAAAGLVDIFLVGAPKGAMVSNDSVLGKWSDEQVDHLVEAFAKRTGWNGKGTASAIGYLERTFPVNYDHRNTTDVGGAFRMGTRNHHLKSLAHSPDPIGLFFSILDQFQNRASFLSDGKMIRIDTESCELYGDCFYAKIFCGFCNWLGHIMSDIAGSSGGRGSGMGRGSGIAIPFYELFLLGDAGKIQIGADRQSFATLMVRVFQQGYDARFGAAMAIPVLLTEIFIRAAWALKQHFYHGFAWQDCIPGNRHADLRCMLIVGNCTLCLFDGVDAAIRSGGNPILFVLHLNIIAWFKLVLMIFKEILIRYDFTYEDLKEQFQQVNKALDAYLIKLKSVDYAGYEKELQELQSIRRCLADDNADTRLIYQYFSEQGISMQFHSFEEFDQKMQDPDFVLEI